MQIYLLTIAYHIAIIFAICSIFNYFLFYFYSQFKTIYLSSKHSSINHFISAFHMSAPIVAYFIALVAIITFANSSLVCPGFGFIRPQEPCVDQCSTENDTCPEGKKCCYTPSTPCGYRCLDAKLNVTRAGSCPSTESEQNYPLWYLCDGDFCDVDSDCRCKKKCCRNKCGTTICINPE